MDEQPQTAQQFLDIRSGQAYRCYRRIFEQKSVNMTLILGCLSREEKMYPHVIAEDLSISTSQMAVLLNHLEASGYVARIPDETDHRRTIVILTPKGREYHRSLAGRYCSFISEIFDRMGQEDSERFVELFSRFVSIGAGIYGERKSCEKQVSTDSE